MSATNRGAERQPDDFYKTEGWVTRSILPHVLDRRGSRAMPYGGGRVLEPAAGDGAIIDELISYGVPSQEIDAFEINRSRAEASGSVCADFLEQTPDPLYGLVIGNPPYERSIEFARHCVCFLRPGGTLALLLRLNWLASLKRAPWLRRNPPVDNVLPKRPSFVASLSCKAKKVTGCKWKQTLPLDAPRPRACGLCGGAVNCSTTDAGDYAWFTWTQGRVTGEDISENRSTTRILEVSP